MQAEIAYRLTTQESRRIFWLNLGYRVETIVTTATVLGTLAVLMIPGVNQSTTRWYGGIEWLHAVETAAPEGQKQEVQPQEGQATAQLTRTFPIAGQTYKTAELTSPYGPRESPGGIGSSFHRGVDYAAPQGTPALAIESGTVEVWTDDSCGNGIELTTAKQSFIYCHLETVKVSSGQKVTVGDAIGTVGSTGNSTGPHLHLGVKEGGDYIDPGEYLKSLDEVAPPQASAAAPAPTTSTPATSEEAKQYFSELQGSEFGGDRKFPIKPNARIEILGNPTEEDRKTVEVVAQELRELGATGIQIVPSGGDVKMYFLDPAEFGKIEPNYKPGNLGWFRSDGTAGKILVASGTTMLNGTPTISQKERSHVIREEMTQLITGLGKDSFRYPDSIFYQPWSDVTQYSELDKAVIRMALTK